MLPRNPAAFAQAGIYYTLLDEGLEIGPLLAAFQKDAERTGSSPDLMSYVSKLMTFWRSRHQAELEQTPTSRCRVFERA